MAFPLGLPCVSACLRRCPGVTPRSSGAAAAAAAGSWVGWALDAGVGCGVLASCAKKAAVDLPQGHTCLVRLPSDVWSPGLGQTFF